VTDLVVMSLEAWDDVWRRNQHLVAGLLRADAALRVLFVEPPADPLHDLVSRRRPAGGLDPVPAPGFEGRLLRFRAMKALPRRIDRRADERLARAVERAAVYVGTLHTDRLDLEVCEATARALGADGRLVLVGPNALDDTATQRLREAGALLLGPRSRDDVIGYLQHAEVLVVPHVVTPFTESLDPIKLYEYTAVGRPVIATPVAGFRDAADADVRVVAASDFPGAVAAALAQPRPPAGRTKAPVASWDERAAAMRAVIDGLARA
jgi:glycosyltransferase involved in cell wall biosynthesis